MPVSWESPKGIDPYEASILATYLMDIKSEVPYSERSLTKPTLEITEKDVEKNLLPCWWLFMKERLEEFRDDQKKKKKPSESFLLWHPPFYLLYPEAHKEYIEFVNRLTEEEIDKAREELRRYIGFKAYAYRKSELRDIEGKSEKYLK